MDRASRPGLGIVAPKRLQQDIARLEHELGARAAARALGLSPETFARMLAGLGVRAGSIALAQRNFAAIRPRKTSSKSATP